MVFALVSLPPQGPVSSSGVGRISERRLGSVCPGVLVVPRYNSSTEASANNDYIITKGNHK